MTLGILLSRGAAVAAVAAILMPIPANSAVSARPPAHDMTRSTAKAGRLAAAAAVVPSNITTADPAVSRPDTKPCSVTLFSNFTFDNFNVQPFTFVPPAACPAPWSKVVLSVNLSVTPGVQYDRTATIGLGGATIFFGTTAEPFSNEGPSWNAQSDLTDLSALFTGPQNGQVSIGNLVNSTYTGVLHGSAQLSFYPPDKRFPAPRVADVVVPLADANGNPVALASPSSTLAKTFTPPTNVEGAYLDVLAQSQNADEFWYTCFPDNLAGPLDNCGSTAFRETDATVDGTPAGVAPVYPWIYTGGIDPFLWAPIPGVQTLNFKPYRVNLTPFAGTLDNGAPHTIALAEFNADNYFAVTANVLLFLDRGAKGALTGKVDVDTLSATPPLAVSESGTFTPNGWIKTASARSYQIIGRLATSHGVVATKIDGSTNFLQNQQILNAPTHFQQNIWQDEKIATKTTTTTAGGASIDTAAFDYPLQLFINENVNADNSLTIHSTVHQGYSKATTYTAPGQPPAWTTASNVVAPTDILYITPAGFIGSFRDNASSQIYTSSDSTGSCYGHAVTSANLIVTSNKSVPCTPPAGALSGR